MKMDNHKQKSPYLDKKNFQEITHSQPELVSQSINLQNPPQTSSQL